MAGTKLITSPATGCASLLKGALEGASGPEGAGGSECGLPSGQVMRRAAGSTGDLTAGCSGAALGDVSNRSLEAKAAG